MAYRRHLRFLAFFLPARWPSGQPAKPTDDRVCVAILVGGLALALTGAAITWWDGSFSVSGYLIFAPIAPLTWFAMNWRLRSVCSAEESVVRHLQDRPRSLHERVLEFGAKKADEKANTLLVRAENKEALGKDEEAARLRRRAAKEKAQAVRGRALINR